jgi:hypothetical protein
VHIDWLVVVVSLLETAYFVYALAYWTVIPESKRSPSGSRAVQLTTILLLIILLLVLKLRS